jgi:hypothetical protein
MTAIAGAEVIAERMPINRHPYLNNSGFYVAKDLVKSLPDLVKMEKRILVGHIDEPFDIMVGDDVSGRVPTLITHYFLKMAAASGYCETPPSTYFMASGQETGLSKDFRDRWAYGLAAKAKDIVEATGARRVALVTEYTATGRAMDKLQDGFQILPGVSTCRYTLNSLDVYLGGPQSHPSSKRDQRAIVGVEKIRPLPVSYRHPDFDGLKTTELRGFLGDMAVSVYEKIFQEAAPEEGLLIPRSPHTFVVPEQRGRLQRLLRR